MIIKISDLAGYDTVKETVSERLLLSFTFIWTLRIEAYVTNDFKLDRRLILELVQKWSVDEAPLLRVTMQRPAQYFIPQERQIIGLGFEDVRDRGLEDINYRVYDYEMSGFSVLCRSVELAKGTKQGS